MANLEYGLLFAIISMLAFGVFDYLFAVAARRVGVFKVPLYFLMFSLPLFALFLIGVPIGPLLYGSIPIIIAIAAFAAIGTLSISKGMSIGQVSIVIPIAATWVVVTVVLSLLFLHEPLTLLESIAIVIIITGTMLASLKLHDFKKAKLKKVSKGVSYALLTAVSWGIYYFLLGSFTSKVGWYQAAFLYNIPAVIFILITGLATGKDVSFPKGNALFLVAVLAVINVIGISAISLSFSYGYVAITAPITSSAIVITVFLALILLKEKPEMNQLLGMALVIAGILLVSI
ncbi:MAG: DMT family transporter [Candidatus Marsarchaeota archaeon]|jgi:transporter family protein|nr:DMT family transporter [Candidatus Marsarchaeota archaeon]MCL5115219.1 DMT family transporter [Candidatus Marsarchaeota archaeon]